MDLDPKTQAPVAEAAERFARLAKAVASAPAESPERRELLEAAEHFVPSTRKRPRWSSSNDQPALPRCWAVDGWHASRELADEAAGAAREAGAAHAYALEAAPGAWLVLYDARATLAGVHGDPEALEPLRPTTSEAEVELVDTARAKALVFHMMAVQQPFDVDVPLTHDQLDALALLAATSPEAGRELGSRLLVSGRGLTMRRQLLETELDLAQRQLEAAVAAWPPDLDAMTAAGQHVAGVRMALAELPPGVEVLDLDQLLAIAAALRVVIPKAAATISRLHEWARAGKSERSS